MIRPLTTADCPQVRVRAETLAASMYPELIADLQKTHLLLREMVGTTKHYARVVGPAGEPQAALIARVQDNTWAMKRSAAMLLWYSDKPGAGLQLLQDFKLWVKEDDRIVLAGMTADWFGETSAVDVAKAMGFKQRGTGTYVYFPRGDLSGSVR